MTTTVRAVQTFLIHDQRLVARDKLLGRCVFLPIVYALIVRWIVPWVTDALDGQFDLLPYYPLINSYVMVSVLPIIWSMIVGFLFLDDRDDGTVLAMQVTPIPLPLFFAYRLFVVWAMGVVSIVACTPLTGIAPLAWHELVAVGSVASLSGCVVTMAMPLIAQNKVQGFAMFKIIGTLVFIPVVAYFVASGWHWVFGVIPFFWGMKLYWMFSAGEANALFVLLIGAVYQFLLTWLLCRALLSQMRRAA